ncbi:AAA family ATPase [Flavobacterium sp. FlaQc-47]|uniref:AAA family ATPase n=1 Tax=Flavobacterium sp. FlaQc-47 TaxID=3374180 RepID=UPI0037563871
MELLYIWIEKFRNIHNKGFNFSNQYEVEYDSTIDDLSISLINGDAALLKENGILKFKADDKYYLKDFFNLDISNNSTDISQISAIIGKNSSGKSNVIDFILTAISKGNRERLNSNYILIFKKNNQPYFWGKTEDNSLRTSSINILGTPLEKIDPFREWDTMFYSNVADNKDYVFGDSTVNNCSFEAMNKLQSNKIRFLDSHIFSDTWQKLNPGNNPDRKIRFIFSPISFIELENSKREEDKISGILKRYRKAIYQESTSNYNRFKYGLTVNLFSFLIIKSVNVDVFLQTIQLTTQDNIAEAIATLQPKILNFLQGFNSSQIAEISELDYNLYIDLLQELETKSYNFGEIERYSNSILVDFSNDFKMLMQGKQDVFNNPDLISHDWSRLSSGMRAYLNLFSQLYSVSEKIKGNSKSLLICIDEGDLYLHPEWQKNFLNDLIWFNSMVFESTKVQMILTSHSPFLISDLPKENVILLDDNCTPTRQMNKESSFGANIHQLFTKQFFLTNGSIGEFAKKKITNLLKEIKEITGEDVELFQQRIDMIGEPVLRFRLEDELKMRLKELSTETQIKWHELEISKLKNP